MVIDACLAFLASKWLSFGHLESGFSSIWTCCPFEAVVSSSLSEELSIKCRRSIWCFHLLRMKHRTYQHDAQCSMLDGWCSIMRVVCPGTAKTKEVPSNELRSSTPHHHIITLWSTTFTPLNKSIHYFHYRQRILYIILCNFPTTNWWWRPVFLS